MDCGKRARCSNFNATELDILLNLVHDHKSIVESKKTDAVSNRDKDAKWEALTEKFNAIVGSGRTSKQLRMKWDSVKKTTRKQYALKKGSLYQTGGGPSCGNLTDWENKVLSIIGISATGVGCSFDSDRTESLSETEGIVPSSVATEENILYEFTIPQSEIVPNEINDHEVAKENETTWTQWNPQSLRLPIHPALQSEGLQPGEGEHESNEGDKEEQSLNSIFKACNRIQTPRKRKRAQSSTPSGRGINNHEVLLNKKLELVNLQIELLKKEHESREARLNEKHALEMELLRCKCRRNIE